MDNDIKSFFASNRPAPRDSEAFISEVKRQLNLLPANAALPDVRNESLDIQALARTILRSALRAKTHWALSFILIALMDIFICMALLLVFPKLEAVFSANVALTYIFSARYLIISLLSLSLLLPRTFRRTE